MPDRLFFRREDSGLIVRLPADPIPGMPSHNAPSHMTVEPPSASGIRLSAPVATTLTLADSEGDLRALIRERHLLARLRSIHDSVDEITIEFGVPLSTKAGAFIASVAVEANFKVSMTWRGSSGA